ncbi:MAG: protein jag [Clostridia bacterium]|nr:protein jag [Clostridia bacterium]
MEQNDDKHVFTGKSAEEATQKGLATLGIREEDAVIEVLDQGKKGIFKSTDARVKVTPKMTEAQNAAEFLEGLLDLLGITGTCKTEESDERIDIEIITTDAKAVLGKKGSTIDALQTLAGAVANIGREEYKKVAVDCEGYRDRRDDELIQLAKRLAKKAIERGKKMTLDPMNPYERRVIHSTLAGNPHVKTVSEGKEPMRRVVIIPDNARPYGGGRGEKSRGGNYGRGGKGPSARGGSRGTFNRDKKEAEGGNPARTPAPPRRKKEMHFGGTYLGNSKDMDLGTEDVGETESEVNPEKEE